jgi:hypothetical protein
MNRYDCCVQALAIEPRKADGPTALSQWKLTCTERKPTSQPFKADLTFPDMTSGQAERGIDDGSERTTRM